MMGFLFWGSAAIAVVGATIGFVADESGRRHAKRTRDLRESIDLLDDYMESLEHFCADQAVPTELKRFLLDFADLLSDKAFVDTMSEALLRHGPTVEARPVSRVIDRVEELALYRSDLASLFYAIFRTSLLSAFLRWPDTARVSKKLAIRLALDVPKKDLSAAVRAKASFSPKPSLAPEQLAYA